jgi:hypothetical protein
VQRSHGCNAYQCRCTKRSILEKRLVSKANGKRFYQRISLEKHCARACYSPSPELRSAPTMTYLEGERVRRRKARRTAPSASRSASALPGRPFARGSEQLQPSLAEGEALPSPAA